MHVIVICALSWPINGKYTEKQVSNRQTNSNLYFPTYLKCYSIDANLNVWFESASMIGCENDYILLQY